MSSKPPKTPPTSPAYHHRVALMNSTAAPGWWPPSRWFTQPNEVILFGDDATCCPLKHIQNSAWDQTWGDHDVLRISHYSLFWIQPTHSLVNISVFWLIPYLFGCIYHTTTCSLMLYTHSHKGDPKIHPDAPRNACGVQTATRWVFRVFTRRSPN
jgi:hypothetical protein